MASVSDKLENALNEGRILILGAQVLVGFGLRSVFEPGFPRLPGLQQQLWVWSLALLMVSFCLLVLPVPFHYVAESGRPTWRLQRLAQLTVEIALVPFAVGMAVYLFIAAGRITGSPWPANIALLTLGSAAYFWYAMPILVKRGRKASRSLEGEEMELAEKVKKVLIEARMVLPGVQALLGFQFVSVLMNAFEQLPKLWQSIYLGALASLSLAVVLLLAPAAYHRIALDGEDSEELVRVASRFVLASLVPLGAAMAADFGVVIWIVFKSDTVAFFASAAVSVFLLATWFGWTLWMRRSQARA
jgi:hypothetical protein